MSNIKIMDELLSNKITAGEVVERPLSIVKELVENSLDAGSTKILINLKESGISSIEVEDNGSGMDKDDIAICIKKHATSKIKTDRDLNKISTLGFRGEALASMCSVSMFEISSSIDGQTGYKLFNTSETKVELIETGVNKGTKVVIDKLFYNTPVRFKHLSSVFYELAIIVNFIHRISLSLPNVSFELMNDGKVMFKTSGNGKVEDIILDMYGLNVAKRILKKEVTSENFETSIYFSAPEDTKSKRNSIIITVNDRVIKNYELENLIIDSYKNYVHTNQFPIVYLNIKTDYRLVDVNIHPTKQQVKISMMEELKELVSNTIRNSLLSITYIPDFELDDDSEEVVKDIISVNNENSSFEYTTEIEQKQMDISFKEEENEAFPMLDYVGIFRDTYLLFQSDKGMHIIDQHAAQERINYEIILERLGNRQFEYQTMLLPLIIEYKDENFEYLMENSEVFKTVGISFEEFGINSIRITEIDSFYFKTSDVEENIKHLINLIIDKKPVSFELIFDDVAIMMACKKSIKANQYTNPANAQKLVQELKECKIPYTCPHGRPVMTLISSYELEKKFKRVF